MSEVTIKNPEFLDVQGNRIRFTIDYNNGLQSIAEMKVPDNRDRGVNDYWDKIMDQYDVDELLIRKKNIERRKIADARLREKKQKASIENEKLRHLFDKKMMIFQMPIINELSDEDKATIRRAPDDLMLVISLSQILSKYCESKNMSMLDFFDWIEDYESNNNEVVTDQVGNSANTEVLPVDQTETTSIAVEPDVNENTTQ